MLFALTVAHGGMDEAVSLIFIHNQNRENVDESPALLESRCVLSVGRGDMQCGCTLWKAQGSVMTAFERSDVSAGESSCSIVQRGTTTAALARFAVVVCNSFTGGKC